jgi:LmbE family N-acetylglucosaminyl deacetylase
MEELATVEAVITHPYEGGHPDHDACAFAVQWAVSLLERTGQPAPRRLEFASYHARNNQAVAGVFWADDAHPERIFALGAEDLTRKRSALDEFVTQRPVMRPFPLEVERLRSAPRYNFTAPPPPRTVLYDQFNWPINSTLWREKARLAALELT